MADNNEELDVHLNSAAELQQPGGDETGGQGAASEEVSWITDEFLNDGDEVLEEGEGEGEQQAPVVEDPSQAVTAQTQPVQEQQPPAQVEGEQQQPAPSQQQQQPPQEEQPPVVQLTPEQRQEQRENYLKQLESQFQLSEDDKVALISSPDTVMPKLAARVHLQAVETVAQMLPAVIEQQVALITQRNAAIMEGVNAFFGEWPELAQHGADVAKALTTLKQVNPNLTREQLIEQAGAFVAQQKGLQLLPKSKRPAGGKPATTTGAKKPAPPPAAAGRGAGSQAAPSAQTKNEWDELLGDD